MTLLDHTRFTTHPDRDIVFVKNEGMNGLGGAYDYDSPTTA